MGIGDLRTDKTWSESLADLTVEFEKWGVPEGADKELGVA